MERRAKEGDYRVPGTRLISFYLPQFHPIPENDAWWGKGFTEWTNVARAKPLFDGHYQPHVPADLGFYDLRLPEVRQAQADLAAEYGIHGFCYHHYWFEGRRILERPLDEVLASGQPDFPFCLCWANHNWTRRWANVQQERLIAQGYSEEDDLNHIRWLLRALQDERYIRVDGRPLLLVYTVQALPDPWRTMRTWREEARRMGVAEPYVCKVETWGNFDDPDEYGCDASVEFPPHKLDPPLEPVHGPEKVYETNLVYEYRDLVERHLGRPAPPFRRFPGVTPSWDNTARFRDGGARIYRNSTPELYQRWLESAIGRISQAPPEERIVFINAWNEWAESAYLEPDLRHGRAYLEATGRALRGPDAEEPSPVVPTSGTPLAPRTTEELYRELQGKYARLQQDLVEQLRVEQQTTALLELQERYEALKYRQDALRASNERLKSRLKERTGRPKDLNKLVRWMRQLDREITIVLNSRTWKTADAPENLGRMTPPKPRTPVATDRLTRILDDFRAWDKSSGRSEDSPDGAE